MSWHRIRLPPYRQKTLTGQRPAPPGGKTPRPLPSATLLRSEVGVVGARPAPMPGRPRCGQGDAQPGTGGDRYRRCRTASLPSRRCKEFVVPASPTTFERSTVQRLLRWSGALVFTVGVGLLLIPVTVHNRGTDVGCGNALIRDPNPAENNAIRHSADGWADLLGFGTDPHAGPSASALCTDALTTRRWVAWTAVLLGVVAAGYGSVASRRTRLVTLSAATEQQTPARHSSPLPPPPTPTVLSHPRAHASFPALPATSAGWYPDQTDPTRVRWFDGAGWTEATLPRGTERT